MIRISISKQARLKKRSQLKISFLKIYMFSYLMFAPKLVRQKKSLKLKPGSPILYLEIMRTTSSRQSEQRVSKDNEIFQIRPRLAMDRFVCNQRG